MIKSLLVPVDSSAYARSALEHALELGKVYQARITGLYVLDVRYLEMPPYLDYSYAFEAVAPTLVPLDVMEQFRAKSERILNELREAVEKSGLEAETRTEEGVPSQAIADVGDACDLIIMGKRGEHARWGKDLLGSTAESVVRRSGTPVLLVEEQSRPVAKMLLMYDGSHSANRALKLAADVARRTFASVKVLTVNDDAQQGAAVQEEARSYLDAQGLTAEFAIEPGRAAKTALKEVARSPVDLVVIGMQGHSALHQLILGSTAEHLMRSLSLPVLLVP
jgi:nucleotide-binding universal stress UspA family protein